MKRKISLFDIITGFIFLIICILMIYPFIYALSYSVSESLRVAQRSLVLFPRGFTLQNYRIIFMDSRVMQGLVISILKTVVGTGLFLVVTGMSAYAMSKQRLKGRKFIFIFFLVPMYVNGGLLPYYVLIHDLGLFNNFLVYIIPAAFGVFYMFLMKVYIESIPESLEESAMLDGAGDMRIALQIYMPLCKPVLATIALFIGVSQWNSWFDALLFVSKTQMQPLQLILQVILRETQINNLLQVFTMATRQRSLVNAESYKMAVLIVTTLPIIFIYPFVQKYFVKGMMIGAVKL